MHTLEQMKKLAGKGKVSRREFVQFAMAAGIAAGAAETMFVKAARAEPKRGGLLRTGSPHGSTTDTLDPQSYLDTYTQSVFASILSNSLTEVNALGGIEGDLAETMEPSDDVKTWVFGLRKGVTFHDGKPLTADDVVATCRFHMSEESKSPVKGSLSSVTDIAADGDKVIFTLADASADFPYLVSDPLLCILPSKDGTVDWQSGSRTGGYVLDKFDPGVSTKMTRNPNYHKADRAWFDACEFLVMPDVTSRTNALTTGEIHYMGHCDLKTLSMLERSSGVTISEVTGLGHITLPMLTNTPPFDNLNVRLALKHAIDRQNIADKIFYGHAKPGNDNPIAPPPSVQYAIDPQPQHAYDPDKAKHYLKEAGLSSLAVDLSMSDAAFEGAVDAGVLMKDHAAKCGIDINVISEPSDGYWDNVWLKKGWSASYWSGRATIDWMFTQAYVGSAAWNETLWKNPRFDELVAGARAELDDAKRAAMYAEAQQLVHDDGGQLVLVFRNFVDAHSSTLAHGDVGRNWELDGYRLAERWWFA